MTDDLAFAPALRRFPLPWDLTDNYGRHRHLRDEPGTTDPGAALQVLRACWTEHVSQWDGWEDAARALGPEVVRAWNPKPYVAVAPLLSTARLGALEAVVPAEFDTQPAIRHWQATTIKQLTSDASLYLEDVDWTTAEESDRRNYRQLLVEFVHQLRDYTAGSVLAQIDIHFPDQLPQAAALVEAAPHADAETKNEARARREYHER